MDDPASRRVTATGAILATLLGLPSTSQAQPARTPSLQTPSQAAATPRANALRDEVWRTEAAFARSMTDRDLKAFASFLSPEAVFWSAGIARGPEAIVAAWTRFYEGPAAPFSWRPETVEVLPSGTLAFSSLAGPRSVGTAGGDVQLRVAPRGGRTLACRLRQGVPATVRAAGGAVSLVEQQARHPAPSWREAPTAPS